jgi:hypothetical protein
LQHRIDFRLIWASISNSDSYAYALSLDDFGAGIDAHLLERLSEHEQRILEAVEQTFKERFEGQDELINNRRGRDCGSNRHNVIRLAYDRPQNPLF